MGDMSKTGIYRKQEEGAITGSILAAIILGVIALALAGFGVWAYVNYTEQKTDVDGKIALAVAEGKKEQSDVDEVKFAEREKEPRREFVGPDDYGRLTFDYPKTWSLYIGSDASKSKGPYEAYLNPGAVVNGHLQYALRVSITTTAYEDKLNSFNTKIKKGDLRSSVQTSNGLTGTRLDGQFDKDVRGAAVIYKLRDKTIFIRTDTDTFKPEFDKIVETIKFNI